MPLNTEKKSRVTSITMEHPPLNVLDIQLLRDLDQELSACAADTTTDVVVLRGAGTRAFSAGVDIRDHTKERVPEMLDIVHKVIRKLLALPQVTIAAVRGVCLGGGCELAACCDFIVASEDSSFATPEIHVGCYPPVAVARFSTLDRLPSGCRNDSYRTPLYGWRSARSWIDQPCRCARPIRQRRDIVTRRTSLKKRSCIAHRAEGFARVVFARFFRRSKPIRRDLLS